jgi:hypothetical protein
MQRRTFIHLSACTAAALSLPFASGCHNSRMDIESRPLFFSHLVDAKTIIETGEAYRKTNKDEDDKNKLAALLLTANALSAAAGEESIISSLENNMENDFNSGKVVVVKGWVLSLTEARQCALFSILQS